ncbi:MAG: acyl-CoA dehydrogenase family protein [Myxococcota bacterium]|nr:acyl-CoA dehydrogenase family protein [Myxococcota bacterium]
MDFLIPQETLKAVEEVRKWGRDAMRPAGLEADRLGSPLPVDHPYFHRSLEHGEGRTKWRPGASAAGRPGAAVHAMWLAEEGAYWDRGVMVANPGPGLPEASVLAQGTEEQKEKYLGPFIEPDRPRWACFAMTEPSAGSDAAAIKTTAHKDGHAWVLNGAKCFIGGASRSDWILVQATLDASQGRNAQRSFFVEQGTPGLGDFKIEKKMGLKAYESTSFTLQSCRVPLENLLGGESRPKGQAGFKTAMRTFNAGRPIIGAMAVGMGRAALDEAIHFAQETGLIKRERIRDRIECMSRKIRSARLICLRACWLVDQQRPNVMEASMAKALGAQVSQQAAGLGLEILGNVAGTGTHLIEKLYRDTKAMDIVEGTGQIQRVIMARQLVGLPR